MGDTRDLQSQLDQNRIDFLRTELGLSLTFANLAQTKREPGKEEHAKRAMASAEKGYATMQRFLSDPKHAEHIKDQERRELTEGMTELRRKLDHLRIRFGFPAPLRIAKPFGLTRS